MAMTQIAYLPTPEKFDLMAYELLNGPIEKSKPIYARDKDGNKLGWTLQEHFAAERPVVIAVAFYDVKGETECVQLVGFNNHAFAHGIYGFNSPIKLKADANYNKHELQAKFIQQAVETGARTIMIRKLI